MAIKTVYWDANIFHALFNQEAGRDICRKIEKAAAGGEIDIYTSAVTFVECVWLKRFEINGKIHKLSPEHEPIIQAYFDRSYIKTLNCDRPIAEVARKLLWKFAIHPKDAIHVASALSQPIDVMHSYDDKLLKIPGQEGAPAIKICRPGEGDGFEDFMFL